VDVVRRWSDPGVTRHVVRDAEFSGYLFEPPEFGPVDSNRAPGVAIVPETPDHGPAEPLAALLASRGYVAMIVGSADERTLPDGRVPRDGVAPTPLESIAAGIRHLDGHPGVASGRLGVACASLGAVGALAALSRFDDLGVRAVVAISPSSVVWRAPGAGARRSSTESPWTLDGAPLPSLSPRDARVLVETAKGRLTALVARSRPGTVRLRTAYEVVGRDARAVERGAIPVERIDAPILFVTGDDDQLWPSSEMAAALIRRRAEAGRAADVHLRYPDAGHLIRPPCVPTTVTWIRGLRCGGTPEGCAAANADSWPRILRFLRERLEVDWSGGLEGLDEFGGRVGEAQKNGNRANSGADE
jgi:dienelactone hydrolase